MPRVLHSSKFWCTATSEVMQSCWQRRFDKMAIFHAYSILLTDMLWIFQRRKPPSVSP